MSSSEDNNDIEEPYQSNFQTWDDADGIEGRLSKRRRGRACDICRRKKIKCDGTEDSNRSCTTCITLKVRCTYAEPSKRRFHMPPEYVDNLKARIKKLEDVLSELFPRANVQADNLTAEVLRRSLLIPEHSLTPSFSQGVFGGKTGMSPGSGDAARSESEQPSWATHGLDFNGKSSETALIPDSMNTRLRSAATYSFAGHLHLLNTPSFAALANPPYPEFATELLSLGPAPQFTFPPEDLMDSLINLFFDKVHWLLPILHIPTFRAQYRSKLYTNDVGFTTILLLVCAIGARYSDDIRVLSTCQILREEEENKRWLYAGLDYYVQILPILFRPPTHSPTLSDIQKFALATIYLLGSKTAPHGWSLTGYGIRLALEAGAHRKGKGSQDPTVESQSWSRAFWALVTLDRLASVATGRPCAVQDEDIDVDLPVGVDDEYWDPPDPKDAWMQPTDKPAFADHFRSMLKLLEILTFTFRTVYSSRKSQLMLGLVGPDWQQRVVSEIDSALNMWVDSIPDHLRWNPHQENTILLSQSAMLNCLYYQVQMLVHRPFISLSNSKSPLAFASLAICTNAARSSSHILDVQLRKTGPLQYLGVFAFTAGVVLLLNLWGMKKLGIRGDPEKHLQDVFKCMKLLKVHSRRWSKAQIGCRLTYEDDRDVLRELLSASDFPQPHPDPSPDVLAGTKRPHHSIGPNESNVSACQTLTDPSVGPDGFDSTKGDTTTSRDSSVLYDASLPSQTADHMHPATVEQTELPFYTTDLKLFPIPPELYYQDGPEKTQVSNGQQSYSGTPLTNLSEASTVQTGIENGPYIWPDVQRHTAFPEAGTSSSHSALPESGQGSGRFVQLEQLEQQGDAQLPVGDDFPPSLYTHTEAFLGQNMLSMWSTAPTSFETQDWGDFAQEYQIEEQLRLSNIFSDAIP